MAVAEAWVGIDAGKEFFHCAAMLDQASDTLVSRRVHNDEAALVALIEDVLTYDARSCGRSIRRGTASLLLALLWERGQRVVYVPGIAVDMPTGAKARPMNVTSCDRRPGPLAARPQ